jgi:hypothetical protein
MAFTEAQVVRSWRVESAFALDCPVVQCGHGDHRHRVNVLCCQHDWAVVDKTHHFASFAAIVFGDADSAVLESFMVLIALGAPFGEWS